MRILFLLFFALTIGCTQRPPLTLTPEQQVYESLFLANVKNFKTPIHIASHTDSRWFRENPIEAVLARAETEIELPENRRALISLLPELYRINSTSEPLGWHPTIVNGVFLPASFAGNPSEDDIDALCLVPDGEGNIRVNNANDERQYRSYYTVSRVAFSNDGKLALLKYGYHCAPLSGAGESLFLFHLQNKRWLLAGGMRFWIS